MYKERQDRIDAYLRDEMSQEEGSRFESDLQVDADLHNDFLATTAIAKALADRKEKIDSMTCWDAEEEIRRNIERRRRMIRWWVGGMGAVACLVIVFFTGRHFFIPHSQYSSTNYSSSPTFASSSSSSLTPLTPVSSGPDFSVPTFSTEADYPGVNNVMVYIDSLIEAKDYEEAIVCVDSLIPIYDKGLQQASSTERYGQNCKDTLEGLEWRRTNLLIVLGKTSEAKTCLKRIIERKGFYAEQAKSIMKTLTK